MLASKNRRGAVASAWRSHARIHVVSRGSPRSATPSSRRAATGQVRTIASPTGAGRRARFAPPPRAARPGRRAASRRARRPARRPARQPRAWPGRQRRRRASLVDAEREDVPVRPSTEERPSCRRRGGAARATASQSRRGGREARATAGDVEAVPLAQEIDQPGRQDLGRPRQYWQISRTSPVQKSTTGRPCGTSRCGSSASTTTADGDGTTGRRTAGDSQASADRWTRSPSSLPGRPSLRLCSAGQTSPNNVECRNLARSAGVPGSTPRARLAATAPR